MRPRHLALAGTLLVAAGFALFGDKTPSSGLAEAVRRPSAAAPAPVAPAPGRENPIVRLQPRAELIGDNDALPGEGEHVFRQQDWTPPPPPPAVAATPPPPAPSAPPLPFSYVGKAVSEGRWEVFLARADQTLIVRTNTVIDGVYRVDAIAPPTITLTYLPLGQVQVLNIGVID